MQRRIAWNYRTTIWPLFTFSNETGTDRIGQNIKANLGEGIALAFLVPKNVVMGLMLKTMREQGASQVFAQKFHAVALVGIQAQTHPKQMNMVGHQAIYRAKQSFARGSVKHYFPKTGVKTIGKPALSTLGNSHCPMNDGITLVKFARQARKMESAVCSPAGKKIRTSRF